ncbi:SID1 transmembrane family member 1-like [Zophobas morio]
MLTSHIYIFMLITTSAFALTTGDLVHVIVEKGSLSDTMTVSLNSTTRRIFVFTAVSSNPFATHVWANETKLSKEHPVIIVVEQEHDILEWSIPLIMERSRSSGAILFNDTCRTLCNSNLLSGNFSGVQNFTVSLSTSSPDNVTVSLKVVEKTEFYLANNQSRNISTIAPGRPQHFLYKPNGTENVGIELRFTSNKNTCFTADIQKIRCPVYVLGEVFFDNGIRQTIVTESTIRVNGGHFANGFVLVFVQEETDYLCEKGYREGANCEEPSVVTIEIKETFGHDEYIYIPLTVFSCIAAFCIFHCFVFCYVEKQQQLKLPSNNNPDSDRRQVENKVHEETNRSTGNNTIDPEEQNNQTDRHQDENEIVEETNRDHENNAINTEIEND